jgi:methionyl-tRNA formyltransferase
VVQPTAGVTYAAKLDKAQAPLDLSQSAALLARRIRAFNPVPGATIMLPGISEPVKVWQAIALDEIAHNTPGAVLHTSSQGIDVACAHGTLRLLELQRPGGKRQPASVFVQSWSG